MSTRRRIIASSVIAAFLIVFGLSAIGGQNELVPAATADDLVGNGPEHNGLSETDAEGNRLLNPNSLFDQIRLVVVDRYAGTWADQSTGRTVMVVGVKALTQSDIEQVYTHVP